MAVLATWTRHTFKSRQQHVLKLNQKCTLIQQGSTQKSYSWWIQRGFYEIFTYSKFQPKQADVTNLKGQTR